MADTPDYVNGEPAPQHTEGPSMHDLVIHDLQSNTFGAGARINDMTRAQLIDYLRVRKEYGFNKYGTVLQAGNGRNARKDALEEVVDLLVYLKQMTIEFPNDGYAVVAYSAAMQVYANIVKSANVHGGITYVIST